MDWEKIGIGAAIGAALLKVGEAVASYLSDKFFPTKKEAIEREKSAFELYNELIIKFNELQKDLISTRERCFEKQKDFESKIAKMETDVSKARDAEKECLLMIEKLQEKIKKYEQVIFNISAEVKSSKHELRSLRNLDNN